ncbi:aminotransferase class I/II-fold pyridoxal phosphate-dependent enzyme [Janibacter cremeus]|uniref:pyridoxal phosphate-dependent aminotransferase n=1 Tax=Janibacter cremeus TaxID=1285192 RepID=UPI0023FA23C4|nr:aminotransferase class I/II-fold pyridoxal phosphate-dependent enzyme [Janibacter cremeus]WEV77599.1 aminotransferase class I/II-fold pyridoxal phosphate-dependent enzyme [Janibacter cremeus]
MSPAPSRRSEVAPFEVMDVLARVAAMRAEGREVISLCAGEPSRGAPAAVHAAAARIHTERRSLGYTPALGTASLRSAIAGHYSRWYGLDLDPGEVAVTTGSSGGFVLAFLAAFDHGDRVALARPGYPAYRNILAGLGCEVVDLPTGPVERYQPTVAQLEAAHAEAPLAGLVLASPANPTGTMVDRGELTAIAAWCAAHGVRLVSDEIYHGVTYADPDGPDAKGVCAREVDEHAIVVSSFSKYWGMTGWRLGWLLVPQDLRTAVDALAGNIALCPPAAAQEAAVEAFTEETYAECEAALADFAEAREVLLARAPELGWGDAAPADGAFYYWADLGEALAPFADSREYATALLEETGVALTPGTDFDPVDGRHCVRLSLAAGPEAIGEALERIIAWQRSGR